MSKELIQQLALDAGMTVGTIANNIVELEAFAKAYQAAAPDCECKEYGITVAGVSRDNNDNQRLVSVSIADNGEVNSYRLEKNINQAAAPIESERREWRTGMSKCKAEQHSDQMVCHVCQQKWDVNDSFPPSCDVALINRPTHFEYIRVDENEPSDLGIWPLEVPDGFTVISVARLKELENYEFMYGSVSK
jgi:hypothetical protein